MIMLPYLSLSSFHPPPAYCTPLTVSQSVPLSSFQPPPAPLVEPSRPDPPVAQQAQTSQPGPEVAISIWLSGSGLSRLTNVPCWTM